MFKKSIVWLLCFTLAVGLLACQKEETPAEETPESEPTVTETPEPLPEPEPAQRVYDYYKFENENFVEYYGPVEHIFFHQVIAYPELAFDGDEKARGIDDWMCT
ncbi:MAG: hypothetical protein ACSW8F_03835, partial [bacterium]